MDRHDPSNDTASEPLHQLIWSFGQRLWRQPVTAHPSAKVSLVKDEGSLAEQMHTHTAHQLATALRMQGQLNEHEEIILMSLESLLISGEVTPVEFAIRAQNLFSRPFEWLDVTLRMKVAAMVLPQKD